MRKFFWNVILCPAVVLDVPSVIRNCSPTNTISHPTYLNVQQHHCKNLGLVSTGSMSLFDTGTTIQLLAIYKNTHYVSTIDRRVQTTGAKAHGL
jgi:hypothetical protein